MRSFPYRGERPSGTETTPKTNLEDDPGNRCPRLKVAWCLHPHLLEKIIPTAEVKIEAGALRVRHRR